MDNSSTINHRGMYSGRLQEDRSSYDVQRLRTRSAFSSIAYSPFIARGSRSDDIWFDEDWLPIDALKTELLSNTIKEKGIGYSSTVFVTTKDTFKDPYLALNFARDYQLEMQVVNINSSSLEVSIIFKDIEQARQLMHRAEYLKEATNYNELLNTIYTVSIMDIQNAKLKTADELFLEQI